MRKWIILSKRVLTNAVWTLNQEIISNRENAVIIDNASDTKTIERNSIIWRFKNFADTIFSFLDIMDR